MKLHASGEDYLEAILVLQRQKGMVRSVDVARHLEVTKPSVCNAVATLRDGGFLTMDEGYFLHLTDVGREVAEQIYEKHRFFTDRLIAAGVDPATAERDACRIEHVISDESFREAESCRETRSVSTAKGGGRAGGRLPLPLGVKSWMKLSLSGLPTRTAACSRLSWTR